MSKVNLKSPILAVIILTHLLLITALAKPTTFSVEMKIGDVIISEVGELDNSQTTYAVTASPTGLSYLHRIISADGSTDVVHTLSRSFSVINYITNIGGLSFELSTALSLCLSCTINQTLEARKVLETRTIATEGEDTICMYLSSDESSSLKNNILIGSSITLDASVTAAGGYIEAIIAASNSTSTSGHWIEIIGDESTAGSLDGRMYGHAGSPIFTQVDYRFSGSEVNFYPYSTNTPESTPIKVSSKGNVTSTSTDSESDYQLVTTEGLSYSQRAEDNFITWKVKELRGNRRVINQTYYFTEYGIKNYVELPPNSELSGAVILEEEKTTFVQKVESLTHTYSEQTVEMGVSKKKVVIDPERCVICHVIKETQFPGLTIFKQYMNASGVLDSLQSVIIKDKIVGYQKYEISGKNKIGVEAIEGPNKRTHVAVYVKGKIEGAVLVIAEKYKP